MKTIERFRGCLLGLAAGDAVGTTLEFKAPGTFKPIEDMIGGGPFNLKPGQWTDDSLLDLCQEISPATLTSLLHLLSLERKRGKVQQRPGADISVNPINTRAVLLELLCSSSVISSSEHLALAFQKITREFSTNRGW